MSATPVVSRILICSPNISTVCYLSHHTLLFSTAVLGFFPDCYMQRSNLSCGRREETVATTGSASAASVAAAAVAVSAASAAVADVAAVASAATAAVAAAADAPVASVAASAASATAAKCCCCRPGRNSEIIALCGAWSGHNSFRSQDPAEQIMVALSARWGESLFQPSSSKGAQHSYNRRWCFVIYFVNYNI